mgnify:CR=1 FL=1
MRHRAKLILGTAYVEQSTCEGGGGQEPVQGVWVEKIDPAGDKMDGGSRWSLAEESMYERGGILAHEQIHVRTNGDLAQMAKRARQCHQEPTK